VGDVTADRLVQAGVALRAAWCRETSSDPDGWSEANPAWGQCAVTALALQDLFGGDLMRVKVTAGDRWVSHYSWRRRTDRQLVWSWDPTWVQFEAQGWQDVERSEPEPRSREYVLSFHETVRRYRLLRDRLAADDRWTTLAPV
jgi:hypothetical protein